MQACLPRSYLIPVRDEEAESQRKARSRHIRQTRRSTQGVTLAELKEAQRNYSPSLQDTDRQIEDGCSRMSDRSCLKGIGEARSNLSQCLEGENPSHTCSREMDKIGNQRQKLRTQASGSTADLANPPSDPWHYYIPPYTSSSLANCKLSRGEDEQKHDSTEDPSKCVLATREKKVWFCDQDADKASQVFENEEMSSIYPRTKELSRTRKSLSDSSPPSSPSPTAKNFRHDRASRSNSSSGDSRAEPLGRTSSYTRRETRLASVSKQEDDSSPRDYKKMYEEALAENDKLKSRLDDSKQELAKIRIQLHRVAQKQDRISERSNVLESEKKEKQVLEKRVTDMEEELKVLTELKSDNQRLKDENGALIRVISKLSK